VWEDGDKAGIDTSLSSSQIPNFPEAFESERLIIRAPKIEDGLDVWNSVQQSMNSLRLWMPWATPELKLHETEESLRQSIADFITRKDLRLHLYLKETGEFIGSSGLHR
ncbi:hypothetical protein J4G37_56975, partial [Microvirga sp. 3-52]|nr:hypothetical protein [Microvirga sp. 3-52]